MSMKTIAGRIGTSVVSTGILCGLILGAVPADAQNAGTNTSPQVRNADNPEVISTGPKLPYRSRMFPYSSLEEALERAENSSYVIALKNWESAPSVDGTEFKTQFKYRYAWDNRAVIFCIDDVSSSFTLRVNDTEVGYSQNGAGRNEFDITEFVHDDYNSVSVLVHDGAAVQRIERSRRAASPRFRTASVITQPTVRIDDVFTDVTFDERAAYVSVDVVMQSIMLNPKEYVVVCELFDPSGRSISRTQKTLNTTMKSRDAVHFVVEVPEPLRWTHETPDLYTLVVSSRYEGRNMEFLSFKTGLRESHFQDGQLFIGEFPVILRGVRYTSTDGSAGNVVADRLDRLKNDGYNCIIVDDGPQPEAFYDVCDSIGLYVCDATSINTGGVPATMRASENPSNNPLWRDAYVDRTRAMYGASHLHPSVVIYSPARNSHNGYCLYESYVVLKELSDAPVYYAEADGYWNNDIVPETLFHAPAHTVAGGLDVRPIRDGREIVFVVDNVGDLRPIEGTYKLELKSGRKVSDTTIGELKLSAGESTELRYALPPQDVAKGSVILEISVKKRGGLQSGGKVSDMYDTFSYTYKL